MSVTGRVLGMKSIVDPTSDLYCSWLGIMSLAVLYNVMVIIVRRVYVQQLHLNYQSTWMTFDYLCDTIYVIDMLLRAHTGTLFTNFEINQSINLLSTVHSETRKCKLRKNAQ